MADADCKQLQLVGAGASVMAVIAYLDPGNLEADIGIGAQAGYRWAVGKRSVLSFLSSILTIHPFPTLLPQPAVVSSILQLGARLLLPVLGGEAWPSDRRGFGVPHWQSVAQGFPYPALDPH